MKFCKAQGWEQWSIKSLTKKDIIAFLDYRQLTKGISNTTRNNYGGYLKTLLGLMVERELLAHNPASGLKKEPESLGHNIAYNQEQLPLLKEAILAKEIRL